MKWINNIIAGIILISLSFLHKEMEINNLIFWALLCLFNLIGGATSDICDKIEKRK